MDGEKRSTIIRAYDKSIIMMRDKSKVCPKDKLLDNCLADAEQCFRLSKDDFWRKVIQYLKLNFEREVKKLYI